MTKQEYIEKIEMNAFNFTHHYDEIWIENKYNKYFCPATKFDLQDHAETVMLFETINAEDNYDHPDVLKSYCRVHFKEIENEQ